MIKLIMNWKWVQWLILQAKHFSFIGLEDIPVYQVWKMFIKSLNEGVLTQRAAAISFSFFLALFPTIMVFFTLIPYLPIQGFQLELMEVINMILPEATNAWIVGIINDIITREQGGVLTIGFILTLFFASAGFKSILIAFNSSVHEEDKPIGFFRLQWVSVVLLLTFTFTSVITISAIIFNNFILSWLFDEGLLKERALYYLIQSGNWLLILSMVQFMIATLYYFGGRHKARFKIISAGSTVFTVVMVLLVVLIFDFYIDNFNSYNVLYGSIGTLLIVLMWIYIISYVLLLGFEINSSIQAAKRQKLDQELEDLISDLS
jgi:membrane protein